MINYYVTRRGRVNSEKKNQALESGFEFQIKNLPVVWKTDRFTFLCLILIIY